MMLSGRPLLATKADRRYVVLRAETTRVATSLATGLNTLLLGAPGSGKTTLLHQAARTLSDRVSAHVVYINASRLSDALSTLVAVGDALHGDETPLGFAFRSLPPMMTAQPVDQVRDPALRLLRSLPQQQPTIVLLDGLAAAPAHALFGQLRDELWQTRITWCVAGDSDDRPRYLAPPADAFFETVVELAPLTEQQQAKLIDKRKEAGDPIWMTTLRVPSGTPRALLTTLRDAQGATDATAGDLLAARAQREQTAARRTRLHSTMLAEIEDGAVLSAADQNVLIRFGISRQRAQQVLADLEQDGLVVSGTRPNPNSGRPRKVYWRVGAS